jgi:hypothetical protein
MIKDVLIFMLFTTFVIKENEKKSRKGKLYSQNSSGI